MGKPWRTNFSPVNLIVSWFGGLILNAVIPPFGLNVFIISGEHEAAAYRSCLHAVIIVRLHSCYLSFYVGERNSIYKTMQHEEHLDCEWTVSGTNSICYQRRDGHCGCLQQGQL